MVTGKINLRELTLVKRYRPKRLLIARAFYIALVGVFIYVTILAVITLRMRFDPLYEHALSFPVQIILLIAAISFGIALMLLLSSQTVLIFKEGIYIKPGHYVRWVAHKFGYPGAGYFEWSELRMVFRAPPDFMGMWVVGRDPLDGLALPASLNNDFDEIQGHITGKATSGNFKVISLGDSNYEFRVKKSLLPLHRFEISNLIGNTIVLSVAMLIVCPISLRSLNSFVCQSVEGIQGAELILERARQHTEGTIMCSYIAFPLIWIIMLAWNLVKRFGYQYLIYKDGLFGFTGTYCSFTHWEEFSRIEKVGSHRYKLHSISPKVNPLTLEIHESDADTFEQLIQSAGKNIETG